MRIYLASDLHVEFFKDFDLPEETVDYVVLAGDIHPSHQALKIAQDFQRHFQVPVLFVCGNHEYYGTNFLEQRMEFRQDAKKMRNIFFLDCDTAEFHDARFLGTPLWSNFLFFGADRVELSKRAAQNIIADFSVIRYGRERFTPDHAVKEFQLAYAWLEEELAKPFNGKTIVITHFLPHKAGVHPMHDSGNGGDHLTPYFTSDCSQLMQRYPIDAWLYGHTHNSVDVIVENGTRLISNQRGYPQEPLDYTCFQPNKIIEL